MPIRTGNSSARCAATAASTAHLGEANAAQTPSPVCLNNQPPCASIALHNTSSWVARAIRISSASASHRRVEPSTSVNKNVTTPEAAGTSAESHIQPCFTSNITGRPRQQIMGSTELVRAVSTTVAQVQIVEPTALASDLVFPGHSTALTLI